MKNQAPSLVCDIHTGREMDMNNQETDKTSQHNIAKIIYANKNKVQKIMIKPNYFKCYQYISQSTKYDVERVLRGYSKGIKFKKGETYTQYARRIRGNKTIMN